MEKSLQKLTLTDRRKLEVGGVLEIISYDDENITMYTALGICVSAERILRWVQRSVKTALLR